MGVWVGLSGSGTIAQTGTAANCEGATPVYYSWWEMFPAAGVPLSVPTEPGDHIQGSVTHLGNDKFTLTVKDVTRGWTRTENKTQVSTGGTPAWPPSTASPWARGRCGRGTSPTAAAAATSPRPGSAPADRPSLVLPGVAYIRDHEA
ncbi:hypothetical protein AV521_41445 [Streptomyces sp. IMTB 2501]|uniref:G1 family glutamic endopeptidase n=1 Tax=Streptomyces sp. IMTB 2501 TaxID=1776340 RepID=UPI00096CCF3C|nr:hypothetical protein AV521_41445 [Streptomyces sp. IMTB 2501]